MDQIPSCHIHSSTRFFIFFQWILKKRDKFCEFIRKWLTNFVKSPQVCNKSYNDLETVLKKKKKKKRNSQYQRNRNKITIYYFKFFLKRRTRCDRAKTRNIQNKQLKPNFCDWRKTSWRRQIITTLISQPISPPADPVKRQKYIILCRRTIIYDLQLLNNCDTMPHCAFVLACVVKCCHWGHVEQWRL